MSHRYPFLSRELVWLELSFRVELLEHSSGRLTDITDGKLQNNSNAYQSNPRLGRRQQQHPVHTDRGSADYNAETAVGW